MMHERHINARNTLVIDLAHVFIIEAKAMGGWDTVVDGLKTSDPQDDHSLDFLVQAPGASIGRLISSVESLRVNQGRPTKRPVSIPSKETLRQASRLVVALARTET